MPGRGERGVALVLVLWVVAILAVLAAGFAQVTRLEARRVSNAVAAAEARALIKEGLVLAVRHLLAGDAAARWRPDGEPRALETPSGSVVAWVTDEGGKLDLNAAPEAAVAALFRAVLPADGERLARAVLAFRNPEQGGRPWLSVAELAGLDAAAWQRLRPHVTVHGRATVNAATADPGTLAALRRLGEAGLTFDPAGGPAVRVRLEVRTARGAVGSAEGVLALRGAAPFRRLEWASPAPTPTDSR